MSTGAEWAVPVEREDAVDTLTRGFSHDKAAGGYRCAVCGRFFEEGEIFPAGSRFFDAAHAAALHVEQEHGARLRHLLDSDSKYLALTNRQKDLFALMGEGLNDGEIATRLGLSASTIRHQRFVFREKARQAAMYLAAYRLASASTPSKTEELLPLHKGATMADGRARITAEERDKILENVFRSLSPLQLKVFSSKEKKKLVILARIAEEFQRGRSYTEKEVNGILADIYEDHVTLRRYLIEYGFMGRSRDCSKYWRI